MCVIFILTINIFYINSEKYKLATEIKVLNEQIGELKNTEQPIKEEIQETIQEEPKIILEPIIIPIFEVTAYYYGKKTSTGIKPYVGICAVDPDIIPYGTKLYLEDVDNPSINFTLIAKDTLSKRYKEEHKGKVIDIFMLTYKECMAFGNHKMRVWIVKE